MTNPKPRIGAMSPLDDMHRPGEAPRTPSSPTVDQLLRGGDPRSSPRATQPLGKEHNMEDDHAPHRKSVLAKVKEKARKWRQTLSKKKHNEDSNATPLWGVSLQDEDDGDENPEYLGAPMYESEMSPMGYKLTARQHPKSVPVISEKHVKTSSVNNNNSNQKSPTPAKAPKTVTDTVAEKLVPAYATVTDATQAIASKIQSLTLSNSEGTSPSPEPNPAIEASLAPKLTVRTSAPPPSPKAKALSPPAPAAIATKLANQAPAAMEKAKALIPPAPASAPAAIETKLANQAPAAMEKAKALSPPAPAAIATKLANQAPAAMEKAKALSPPAPAAIATKLANQAPAAMEKAKALSPPAPAAIATKLANQAAAAMEKAAPPSAPAAVAALNDPSTGEQIWDKRVSVKEYIMQKLEPGEDDRALSQVISQAISPRKTPNDTSVVEKVKEAVTSLLRNEESYQHAVYHSAQNSLSHIPISTNAHEVVDEENHGRVLHAN